MGDETQGQEKKPHGKLITFLKIVGGIASLPLIMWVGNIIFSMVEDGVKAVEDLRERVIILENQNTNKEAIWRAIAENRQHDAKMLEEFNSMSVKYEAAMLVFEKHFMRSNYTNATASSQPASQQDQQTLTELIQKMIEESQKSEGPNDAELDRIRRELERMKEESNNRQRTMKQHEELIRRFLNRPPPPSAEKVFDPDDLRKKYEDYTQQQQFQFPKPKGK